MSAPVAEATLARDYERLRTTTLEALGRKLRARGLHVDPADLDAIYNQAWHGLWLRLREGDQIESPAGFLVQAAFFRAVDEVRRTRPGRRDAVEDLDALGADADLEAHLDDRDRLRAFVEGLRDRLDARECEAAALCYLQGYSRPEAAELLGLSPGRMQKLMDGVSKKVGTFVADIEQGVWCERRRSLMTAYALGLLDVDGDRYEQAVAHLDHCPGCRRLVRSLRGLAAICPPATLPWAVLGLSPHAALTGTPVTAPAAPPAPRGSSAPAAVGLVTPLSPTGAGSAPASPGGSPPPGGLAALGAAAGRRRARGRQAAVAAAGLVLVVLAGAFALGRGEDHRPPARTSSSSPGAGVAGAGGAAAVGAAPERPGAGAAADARRAALAAVRHAEARRDREAAARASDGARPPAGLAEPVAPAGTPTPGSTPSPGGTATSGPGVAATGTARAGGGEAAAGGGSTAAASGGGAGASDASTPGGARTGSAAEGAHQSTAAQDPPTTTDAGQEFDLEP